MVGLKRCDNSDPEDQGTNMKKQSHNELRGYEFMDIAGPRDEACEMKWCKLSESAGRWPHLLRHNPSKVQPVIFCANRGHAIAAATDDCNPPTELSERLATTSPLIAPT